MAESSSSRASSAAATSGSASGMVRNPGPPTSDLPQLRLTGGARYTDDKKTASGVDTANLSAGRPTVYPQQSRHFKKVTYRGAIDYQIDQAKLLYASISNGFRSGGFNPLVIDPLPNDNIDITFFRPETVTAYEIGAKTRWLDNKLQINLAAFVNNYSDIQINGFDLQTFLTYTQNVGRRRAKGIEAEVLVRPVPAFELGSGPIKGIPIRAII